MQAAAGREGKQRFKFFRETIGELRKVVWLSRREVIYLTVLVVVVSGLVGLVLGALDLGFSSLIDIIVIGR
jgi:preprotein translocase subunit SecE